MAFIPTRSLISFHKIPSNEDDLRRSRKAAKAQAGSAAETGEQNPEPEILKISRELEAIQEGVRATLDLSSVFRKPQPLKRQFEKLEELEAAVHAAKIRPARNPGIFPLLAALLLGALLSKKGGSK